MDLWRILFVLGLFSVYSPTAWAHCTESDVHLKCDKSQDMTFEDLQAYGLKYPNLTSVMFTGHNITYLGKNSLGDRRHDQLISYNLSNNMIRRIDPGAFHYMRNLKTLILDDNDWNFNASVDHSRLFNHSDLTTLSLNNAFAPMSRADKNSSEIYEMLKVIFFNSSMESLTTLSMRNNRIDGLPSDFFDVMPNLETLDLSHNQLPGISFSLERLKKLKVLHLQWNSITRFHMPLLHNISFLYEGGNGQLETVTLSKNPINCDCSAKDLWSWLNFNNHTRLVKDLSGLTCSSAPVDSMVGSPLMSFSLSELECKEPKTSNSYTVLGIVLGVVGLVALVILFLNRSIFINKYRSCRETLGNVLVSKIEE